jgi:hypothetical protein
VRDSNIVCGGDDETALTRVDDRERAEAEFVLPSIPFPALEGTKILCAVESSGLVRFRDLPAREIHLELAGGGFTSRVVIPPSDSEVRVEARLVRAEEDAEKVPPVARPWTFREHEAERSR